MSYIREMLSVVAERNPGEPAFVCAADRLLRCLEPVLASRPDLREERFLERLLEPERVLTFALEWQDSRGRVQVNRGACVRFSSLLGPCPDTGCLEPGANVGVLKSLALDRTFTNALPEQPFGGGAGGVDVEWGAIAASGAGRFCRTFADELARHTGGCGPMPSTEDAAMAPAGWCAAGMSCRDGAVAAACPGNGGDASFQTLLAAGRGCATIAAEALRTRGDGLDGKVCTISGCGRTAQALAARLRELGASVISLSDTHGTIYDANGIDDERLAFVQQASGRSSTPMRDYSDHFPDARYRLGTPWKIRCDCAFPCAAPGEIGDDEAAWLLSNGCTMICEGRSLATSPAAGRLLAEAGVVHVPGTLGAAGGPLSVGLNGDGSPARFDEAMVALHDAVRRRAAEYGRPHDYLLGTGATALLRIADAMLAATPSV